MIKSIPYQVCMLTLSVVTLSVCLISVIFFVGVEEGVESESALYVLGKFSCLHFRVSSFVYIDKVQL